MKIFNYLSNVMLYATMAVAAGLMLLTVTDVGGRYFFSHPVQGTTEITEFLMVCLLMGTVPCALAGRMVKIDFLVQHLPKRVQAILEVIFYVAGLGIVAMLVWAGLKQGLTMLDAGARSSMLEIPEFPFMMVLVVSYAVLFVTMVVLMIKKMGEVLKR